MEERLRALGVKLTPQRVELSKTIKEIGIRHPSFNEVYKAVKAKHPSISRSTVHYNLKSMIELGLIGSFSYRGETRYETNPALHINLAEPDGRIRDIKKEEVMKYLQEIIKLIDDEEGIHVRRLIILAEIDAARSF